MAKKKRDELDEFFDKDFLGKPFGDVLKDMVNSAPGWEGMADENFTEGLKNEMRKKNRAYGFVKKSPDRIKEEKSKNKNDNS